MNDRLQQMQEQIKAQSGDEAPQRQISDATPIDPDKMSLTPELMGGCQMVADQIVDVLAKSKKETPDATT